MSPSRENMSFDQAKSNLLLIYDHPEVIYVGKKNGELSYVSKWNWIGRLICFCTGSSSKETVAKVIENSLDAFATQAKEKTSLVYQQRNRRMPGVPRRYVSFSSYLEKIGKVIQKIDKNLENVVNNVIAKCEDFHHDKQYTVDQYNNLPD